MLHAICTRLRLAHLSVRVGDSSRRCEEIVKKSRIAPLNVIVIIVIVMLLIQVNKQTATVEFIVNTVHSVLQNSCVVN